MEFINYIVLLQAMICSTSLSKMLWKKLACLTKYGMEPLGTVFLACLFGTDKYIEEWTELFQEVCRHYQFCGCDPSHLHGLGSTLSSLYPGQVYSVRWPNIKWKFGFWLKCIEYLSYM